jgi:hypothetical protein
VATSGTIIQTKDDEVYGNGDTLLEIDVDALDIQFKAVELGFRAKGMLAPEKHEHSGTVATKLEISEEDRKLGQQIVQAAMAKMMEASVRSLLDVPANLIPLCEASDPWAWAYLNEIRLVGATFQWQSHEFQAEPMQAKTRTVTVRKATQMAFTEGAVLKVLHAMIHRQWPKGCIYLFPNGDTVTDFSSSRFGPLIRDNQVAIGQYVETPTG